MPRTRIYFDDPTTDKLLAMLLTLASEVWTLRERFAVIETLASRHGVPLEREVEDYEFTEEQATRLAQLRNNFIGNLFRVLHQPVASSSATARKRRSAGKKAGHAASGKKAGRVASGKKAKRAASGAGRSRKGASASRAASRKTSRRPRRPK